LTAQPKQRPFALKARDFILKTCSLLCGAGHALMAIPRTELLER